MQYILSPNRAVGILARLLNVSRPTLMKYVKAGELPRVKIGRCRRIRRSDLEAFLAARTAYG